MKIKVEDLKCYRDVEFVLGKVAAKTELFKVVNSGAFKVDRYKIGGCFSFNETPQGKGFWSDVRNRIVFKVKHTG